MLRPSLAAAVQWSSQTASRPTSEGMVGRVYSSGGKGPVGGYTYPYVAAAAVVPPATAPAHAPTTAVAPAPALAAPTAPEPPAADAREAERLRRELRKAEEKANFFRNQVLTLQQQIAAMSSPIMAQQDASQLPEELARLRQELNQTRQELSEERRQRKEAEQQLEHISRACGVPDAESALALLSRAQAQREELSGAQAQVEALQKQLSVTRQQLEERVLPDGPSWTSAVTVPALSFPELGTGMVVSEAFGIDFLDPKCPAGPKRALIVGCDYPQKPGTIRAGIIDAMQWYRFFQSRCGFTDKDMRLLADDASNVPVDSLNATRENLLRGLAWLVARSAPGDQLFFIFCGHGAQIPVQETPESRLCECALVPSDAIDGKENPRMVRDFEIHQALATLPSGVQVTMIVDGCHAGHPLDRLGDHRFHAVARGHVDYEKLRHHPVLPRFFELPDWKLQTASPMGLSLLRCQAVLFNACANHQFCVELPIDECKARGVFTYIFMSAILKAGVQASCGQILFEAKELTAQLRGRYPFCDPSLSTELVKVYLLALAPRWDRHKLKVTSSNATWRDGDADHDHLDRPGHATMSTTSEPPAASATASVTSTPWVGRTVRRGGWKEKAPKVVEVKKVVSKSKVPSVKEERKVLTGKLDGKDDADALRAAVIIVGAARSLLWNVVCSNIKTRLLDGLATPVTGQRRWKLDVIRPCAKLLQPVYMDFMAPKYEPPKHHNCSLGMEPSYSKRRDQARAYSQCKRLEIAFDSVFKDFEPNMSYKYSAIVRARPDAIYLTTVPPLSSFNLSRFTFSTGAVSDHWHVVGRGCPLVSPYCIHCQDHWPQQLETRCHVSPETAVLDSRVQLAVARERDVECGRWKVRLTKYAPQTYQRVRGMCDAEALKFLRVEDGPTLLSCPENRPFKECSVDWRGQRAVGHMRVRISVVMEVISWHDVSAVMLELQRFGQPFWGHFRRKKLKLPETSMMPYGLQIVDTPGMIDMPVKSESMAGGRGYNFLEVVRWFAKRADLILLLFDPDRPGTTGESLDVLTRSMAGLDHKFVIILNKVDQLDSSVDFARAYGTLGWALSKVIPRKDIPQIYTMYNAGVEQEHGNGAEEYFYVSMTGNGVRQHKLPLEAFRQKREEVVAEVLRARTRHWDNVITATEEPQGVFRSRGVGDGAFFFPCADVDTHCGLVMNNKNHTP
ncbi:Metacaspase-1A [Durusdinium trenchii]|uniref:Metacaspase-1A n=1 Tax=Durusdinium trenchii TaxID=1381693 RepID=A0ABP0JR80_9DINO